MGEQLSVDEPPRIVPENQRNCVSQPAVLEPTNPSLTQAVAAVPEAIVDTEEDFSARRARENMQVRDAMARVAMIEEIKHAVREAVHEAFGSINDMNRDTYDDNFNVLERDIAEANT